METITKTRERVKTVLAFSLRTVTLAGLAAVLFEEALPEPVAKPIVVSTVFLSIGLHLWAWRRSRRWLRHS